MMTSSSAPFFRVGEEDEYGQHPSVLQQPSSAAPASSSATVAPQKKKRNLPGKPSKYPDAEVIALSPKSLLATNRFVCEVCNKGFQREQNLQLHRRGHNLPWKLKQKNPNEVRRRVYLCPEPTCVHHDPSRALGDLTGIKKHYCRKHGEKKWKCDKCSKRYAVHSDWKAHSKICGTREYRCDCGTLFSRRDSFITHRAFCDALAQENARLPAHGLNTSFGGQLYANRTLNLGLPQLNPTQLSSLLRTTGTGAAGASQFDHVNMATASSSSSFRQPPPPQQQQQQTHPNSAFFLGGSSYSQQGFNTEELLQSKPFHGMMQLQDLQTVSANNAATSSSAANLFDLGFFSGSAGNIDNVNHMMNNHIDTNMPSPFYNPSLQGEHEQQQQQMPATALLHKAAQMELAAPTSNFRPSFYMGGRESGSSRSQLEQENHFQDLINSITNGNGSGTLVFGNEQMAAFGGFNPAGLDQESKLHHNLTAGGRGGITRDFLGVGGMVRSMTTAGGVHLGVENINSMDSEMKARSFGAGRIQ
ncbi:protein indeterminate-domain 4, chloroplastic-like isoform X1 [Zingiber officinale]|uniref:Protein EARLY HEADING DATE 2 n=1 Tax=Zingiber officinale TaxID=94328 RepID=A0A8J5ITZ9_ZINOF|nr:protein indeterminate-domain 4, chloroplastic-like isoform X1 [Zingiber officinale]XP_042454031.1 protein indeterminate-domain 4, chloroplastic-like isoform X1 [Zingiber officinale]XP_042454032.1 protein indeterminate-domain 4, chloroplastic-like isoform X1 [Zingiber officinale]XP_042454033.1 protein indeterminate-domain 4, chloroplastic-like isoform X1 [Zingiber officinale]XP_042454036.1 protein indeterminate-domain 4, chloroplastic-like isoform X1 [Zingiber officinale]XP_042454037.1 prote